ncbi:hypothetical protein G3580_03920 [Nitrogeniibacter mangrovi]|uniref:Hydrazine synthase alpha subunit middle domain-containing protein n=1 Tax=Nitrogeniibacter mangrovi TaxID=2016596 RepID=A0A6C1B1R0_9RHOO|nr:hypothetical protein [Nitrogeniibacter mangrovi]QID16855.1 hypothetical protein G3580_03920 [Nitrogeniibacter mangrovi]
MIGFLVPGDGAAATDTTTPLIWVEVDLDRTPSRYQGEQMDHPDICVTLPEVNNRQNNGLPADNVRSNGLSGPGRLMRRDRTGKVSVLYDCAGQICTPTDPRLSPDGTKVAFTIYRGTQWQHECGSGNLTLAGKGAGANIAIVDLVTGKTSEWPFVPGRHDLTPVIINQGGALKVMFSSDRAQEFEPVLRGVTPRGDPNLQNYIADLDGSDVHRVGTHDFVSFYGGFQLRDGRILASCAQWLHDLVFRGDGQVYTNYPSTVQNMWWTCAVDPWGGSQESPFGAHYQGKALHFINQLSDGRILVGEYYRGNYQNGFGNIWAWSPAPFTVEGVPVSEARKPVNDALLPRDLVNLTPWASSEDQYSRWDAAHAAWQGRVRDPFGLPGDALGFVWCRGVCNNQGGWRPDGMDARVEFGPHAKRQPQRVRSPVDAAGNPVGLEIGIYKLPADKLPSKDYRHDPVMMVDKPGVAEYGAIYGGPYVDVYGQAMPDSAPQPRSADGACYLQIASQRSETTNFDVRHGQYRWGHDERSPVFGKELPGVSAADVKYIRIARLIPNAHRLPASRQWTSMWGVRTEILGDAPVAADGSVRIRVPCEAPWLLSGLNADHEVIKRDMMPQSLRAGTTLTCGGCHNHGDKAPQPVFARSLAAKGPAVDLSGPGRAQPEYTRDIVPILERRCVACHSGRAPAGGIDFNDRDDRDGMSTWRMLLMDYPQVSNPRPVRVSPEYRGKRQYYLDRPQASWLINGDYAAGSGLYWYFRNRRTDYRSNAASDADYDYDEAHPHVEATPAEIATVRDWIDTGAYRDPRAATTAPRGAQRRVPTSAPTLMPVAADIKSSPPSTEVASDPPLAHQPPGFVSFDLRPTKVGRGQNPWMYFQGTWHIRDERWFDPHGVDFQVAYARRQHLPPHPRLLVTLHPSAMGNGYVGQAFAPPAFADFELRNQDAQIHSPKADRWTEWWTYSRDGVGYPGRRLAGSIEALVARYPQIDVRDKGFILAGSSMGGGGAVVQSMILPAPWRSRIAYVTAAIGGVMPRLKPDNYRHLWPPDSGATRHLWDAIDFSIQARSDPIVRNLHYRHRFSSNDPFFTKDGVNEQMPFVNICEAERISCEATWVQAGHAPYERGVKMPSITDFEVPEQDVTLDRAFPAITHSTGNFPLTAAERLDTTRYPRGHYNLGIVWNHAQIVDDAEQIVFPLRYVRHTGFGGGIPDQPESVTVSVTPRRARHFRFHEGEILHWSWDDGAMSGTAVVKEGTVTVDRIPLTAGAPYKRLRIFRSK